MDCGSSAEYLLAPGRSYCGRMGRRAVRWFGSIWGDVVAGGLVEYSEELGML